MAARSKARKRAFEVLFEAEQRGISPVDVLRRIAASRRARQPPVTSTRCS